MRVLPSILIISLAACTPQQAPAAPAAPTEAAVPADAAPPALEPPHADPAPPVPPITGGYAPANLEDANVKAAQKLAVDEIYKRDTTRALVEKVEAQVQVVAGLNYAFDITMTGGAHFKVVVYRDLQQALSITSYEKVG